MGALRITGVAVWITGIVGFVVSLVLGVAILTIPGRVDGLLGNGLSPGVVNLMISGLLWGPLLIVLGLGLRYASVQRRTKAEGSS